MCALDVEAGRVTGVIAEGAGSRRRRLCVQARRGLRPWRRHRVSIPQHSVRATVVRTMPLREVFADGVVDHRLAFRRCAGGGYSLAPEGAHDVFIGPDALRALTVYLPLFLSDPFGTALKPAAPRGYPQAWGTPRRWAQDAGSPFGRKRELNPPSHRTFAGRILRDFAETFPCVGSMRGRCRGGAERGGDGRCDARYRARRRYGGAAAGPHAGDRHVRPRLRHGPAFGRIVADLV